MKLRKFYIVTAVLCVALAASSQAATDQRCIAYGSTPRLPSAGAGTRWLSRRIHASGSIWPRWMTAAWE